VDVLVDVDAHAATSPSAIRPRALAPTLSRARVARKRLALAPTLSRARVARKRLALTPTLSRKREREGR